MNKIDTKRDAILVAGFPRSGSTVLANILSMRIGVGYVEEPLNPQTGIVGTTEPLVFLHENHTHIDTYNSIFTNVLDGNAQFKKNELQKATKNPARKVYQKLFNNRYSVRYKLDAMNQKISTVVLKDPTAVMSAEYLCNTFNVRAVLTFRHPAAVVASHLRLGWQGALEALVQKEILNKKTRNIDLTKLKDYEKTAWAWKIVNDEILAQIARNKNFLIFSHEHFSRAPITTIEALYKNLSLPFDEKIKQKVGILTGTENSAEPKNNSIHDLRRDSRANIDRWRDLITPRQEKCIMQICEPTYNKILKLTQ